MNRTQETSRSARVEDPDDASSPRARVFLWLWVIFIALAVYGSIYPFNFVLRDVTAGELQAFLASCCRMSDLSDTLANILLFVPIGFFGMLSGGPNRSSLAWFGVVSVTGIALALALQIAQIYLPERDQSLQDVLWNYVGIGIGACGVCFAGRLHATARAQSLGIRPQPFALIVLWVAYRLFPFVPSFDFQGIKDSIKPLLLHPQFGPIDVFSNAVAWLVVACLMRAAARAVRVAVLLPLLMGGVFLLEVLIAHNAVTASNVAGASIALVVWWLGAGRVRRWESVLLVLLLGDLLVQGLWPPVAREYLAEFRWLPFSGFLHGSMFHNTLAALEKLFVYGSLSFLVIRSGINGMAGAGMVSAMLLAVEVAQTYLVGHTPEITDPLLFVGLFWLLVRTAQGEMEDRA